MVEREASLWFPCRWIMPNQALEKVDSGKKPAQAVKRTIQKFVEKENPDGIGSSKAFSSVFISHSDYNTQRFYSGNGSNTCSLFN
jgi:hypothetical protein